MTTQYTDPHRSKLGYWLTHGPPRPPFTPAVLRKTRESIERSRHTLEACIARGGDLAEVEAPLKSLAPEMDRILEALNLIRALQELNVAADFWWYVAMWGRFGLAVGMLLMAGWGWEMAKSIPLCAVIINCRYLFPANDGFMYVAAQLKTLGRGFFFEHFLNTCLLLIYCSKRGPVVVAFTAVYW
ncbi:uncharacterized protein H6S33_002921 [Morchella sextelata]|uniref:uncharacterized protein n=1 Tax=Morchella sextelata TaxID=1174677 RepID=UPI001D04B4B0|nr:uncharacterized protein H6S33_002921 [Morchella sextelata]KAH0606933.1 hypothetical protein H6S33_002921 [Morchella sextelata]